MKLEVDVACTRGDFSLEAAFCAEGPLTALFGPSGAGKSSVLHIVAGLLRPSRGHVILDGEPLFDESGASVPAHRRRVGYVFQDGRLFPHLDVRRNLLYGARDARDLDDLVALLDIGPLLDRRPAALSGGERQRVALGRALLSRPRLLLYDEPLTGVQHGLKQQIIEHLIRVRDELGVPAIYVSHVLEDVLQLTQQFVLIQDGRVVASGDYFDVLRDERAFAVAERMGLINVIDVEVAAGPDEGVVVARLGEQTLRLPPWDLAPGDRPRIAVRPRDIVVATGDQRGLSLQNRLAGAVVDVSEVGGLVLLRVDVGQPLLVEVTRRAVTDLQLAVGDRITCMFKASAIERVR